MVINAGKVLFYFFKKHQRKIMWRLSASVPFVSVNRSQLEEVKFDGLLCWLCAVYHLSFLYLFKELFVCTRKPFHNCWNLRVS
jgi:hypothetical protein